MKVYNDTILNELQSSIDSGRVTAERQEYGFLKALDSAGVRIELYFDQRLNLPMGQNVINNERLDSSYLRIWRAFAPGKYLIKDYRKQIKNTDGECPYQILRWTSDENQKLRALIREILDGDNEDTDITLDKRPYKVIKIVDEDVTPEGWITFEAMVPDIAHCLTLNDEVSDDDDEDFPEEEPVDSEEDENEEESSSSNPLF